MLHLFWGYFFKNPFGCWNIFTWLWKLTILDIYIHPWLLRDNSDDCRWNSDRTYIDAVGYLNACRVVARKVQLERVYTSLPHKGLKRKDRSCKLNENADVFSFSAMFIYVTLKWIQYIVNFTQSMQDFLK